MTRAQRAVRATINGWIGSEPTGAPDGQLIGRAQRARSRLERKSRARTLQTTGGVSIELEHVTKDYGNVHAVVDFSLTVQPGRFLTLLGPSGSGKTTVLQLIAGLIEPTSGAIRINGQPTDQVPADRRNIGVVFQHYALFPHLTVAQNLAFPLEMRRMTSSDIHTRVGEALELVGLAGLEARRPRELSGGQQQRVALARALIYRPPVILMDEPLGALDKNLRQQMQVEIKRIQSDLGLTVIYVTHDQTEALQLSDDLCVISAGRLVQVGPPRQLYDRPANEFVATFLGEANLFPGWISEVDAHSGIAKATGPHGLGGLGLSPSAAGRLRVGAPVTIVVRPEDVRLEAGGDRQPAFDALVEMVAFVGDAFRVQLAVEGRATLVAKLPKTSAHPPAVGATVSVSWREQEATFVLTDQH